jgi:FdhD protein
LAYDPDNLIEVELGPEASRRRGAIEGARREMLSVAACGLCGKARLETIYQRLPPIEPIELDPDLLLELPARMEAAQVLFPRTGGVHAAALFDAAGSLLSIFEDVGRHNALDKLVGHALLAGTLPWHGKVVVTSARAGFELVQKAMLAGASALVAVGATSSLAVETAHRGGLALYGFTRTGRSNRYC